MRLTYRPKKFFDSLLEHLRHIANALDTVHADFQQHNESANARQEHAHEKQEIRPSWLDETFAKYDQTEESKAADSNRHYIVQNSLKNATWAAFIAATLYGAVAILQWCAMQQTYKEIQKQSTIASRQLEMADRPWLKDEIKSASDFTFQNGTAVWAISIKSQNIGHSVATETFSEARMIAIHNADMLDGPRKKVTEICESMPKRFEYVKAIPGLWNNSIFPNDSHETVANVILSPKDIGDTLDGGNSLGKSMIPVLVGCLEYRYPTSDKPHHTGFVYVLSHNENPSIAEAGRTFFSVGQNIAKDNVVLRKFGQVAD